MRKSKSRKDGPSARCHAKKITLWACGFLVGIVVGCSITSALSGSLTKALLQAGLSVQQLPVTPTAPCPSGNNPENTEGQQQDVIQRTKSTTATTSSSRLQFVLVAGLEGTGHHFMQSIFGGSPHYTQLKQLFNIPGAEDGNLLRKKFEDRLYNNIHKNGLWNAHCNIKKKINVTAKLEEVVLSLLQIDQLASNRHKSAATAPSTEVLRYPINLMDRVQAYREQMGMMSFPSYKDGCRKLNYPSLDLWYEACRKAGVDCRHVYLHRDVTDILYSTCYKRPINSHVSSAVHLYKSLLHVLVSELDTFRNHTLACLDLFSPMEKWSATTSELWGWGDMKSGQDYMQSIYKKPKPTTQTFIESIQHLQPYLEVLKKANDKAIATCRRGLIA